MIVLTDSMLLGVSQVDHQHRALVQAINQFAEACNQGKGRKQIEQTLKFVVSYTQDHFKDEERIQRQYSYPGAASHKLIHEQFISQAGVLLKKFRKEGPTVALVGELNETLVGWVVNHIKTEDKKIGDHILRMTA